jgi:valyl-tRNA synthetase
MHDWCISRQLWWGHRIPVWYSPDGEPVCPGPDEEPPSGPGWHQDPDVLDTWFSSALWPFSTLGWPDSTPDLRVFYPTSVLVTGYDILFFWVARMMMFGLYAMDAEPFRDVALHGLVRDQYGRKMSKSRGNTVDPLDWIDRFGADATRFTLARGSSPGSDVAISEEWAAGARNFCNKLWNAARFALRSGAGAVRGAPGGSWGVVPPGGPAATAGEAGPSRWHTGGSWGVVPPGLALADRWILSRLAAVTGEVDELFERFEIGKACDALYHFAWDEFCDWYLELAKVPLGGDDHDAAAVTRAVLGHVLDALLRLIHPVMPFVTDELWTHLTGGESVMIASWPGSNTTARRDSTDTVDPAWRDPQAEAEVEALMRLVTQVRRFRSDQGLRPSQPVPAVLAGIGGTPLASHEAAIRSLLRLAQPGAEFAPTASVEAEGVTVRLDTAAAIDIGAERRRLEKDLAAAKADTEQSERKLANPSFVERAPDVVVAKSRDRLAAARAEIASLEQRLAALPASPAAEDK